MNNVLDFTKVSSKIDISNVLPPPKEIYDNTNFFINYDMFIQDQDQKEIQEFKEKINYFLLHNIKTNFNKLISYQENTFITDIYDSLDSFDSYQNENIIYKNELTKFSSYYNLYNKIINKKDYVYFWHNQGNIFISYNSDQKNIVKFINNIKTKKNIQVEVVKDLQDLTNDKIFLYRQQNYQDLVEEEEIVDMKTKKKILRVKTIKDPLFTVIISLTLI